MFIRLINTTDWAVKIVCGVQENSGDINNIWVSEVMSNKEKNKTPAHYKLLILSGVPTSTPLPLWGRFHIHELHQAHCHEYRDQWWVLPATVRPRALHLVQPHSDSWVSALSSGLVLPFPCWLLSCLSEYHLMYLTQGPPVSIPETSTN